MQNEIVNRVAQSSLLTVNPKDFLPKSNEFETLDLKDFLFKEFILKEKEFRAAIAEMDLSKYKDKAVGVFCSNEAIIPQWAAMLVISKLKNVASRVYFKNEKQLQEKLFIENLKKIELKNFEDKPVIIKGCGAEVPASAYLEITNKLLPVVKSLMYGEACSTVPIYKKKKEIK